MSSPPEDQLNPTYVLFPNGTVCSSTMCILTGIEQCGKELTPEVLHELGRYSRPITHFIMYFTGHVLLWNSQSPHRNTFQYGVLQCVQCSLCMCSVIIHCNLLPLHSL